MKRLEGEVLEALATFPTKRALPARIEDIDPHQFLGLEVNPRAAAIAELVLWIGFLQWHFRTRGGFPPEPILKDFQDDQGADAVLTWNAKELARDDKARPVTRARTRRAIAWRSGAMSTRSGRNGRRRTTSSEIRLLSAARIFADGWAKAMRKRFGPRIRI